MQRRFAGAKQKLTKARNQTFHPNLKITWQSAAAAQKQKQQQKQQLQVAGKHNGSTKEMQKSRNENEAKGLKKKKTTTTITITIKYTIIIKNGSYRKWSANWKNKQLCMRVYIVVTKVSAKQQQQQRQIHHLWQKS